MPQFRALVWYIHRRLAIVALLFSPIRIHPREPVTGAAAVRLVTLVGLSHDEPRSVSGEDTDVQDSLISGTSGTSWQGVDDKAESSSSTDKIVRTQLVVVPVPDDEVNNIPRIEGGREFGGNDDHSGGISPEIRVVVTEDITSGENKVAANSQEGARGELRVCHAWNTALCSRIVRAILVNDAFWPSL